MVFGRQLSNRSPFGRNFVMADSAKLRSREPVVRRALQSSWHTFVPPFIEAINSSGDVHGPPLLTDLDLG